MWCLQTHPTPIMEGLVLSASPWWLSMLRTTCVVWHQCLLLQSWLPHQWQLHSCVGELWRQMVPQNQYKKSKKVRNIWGKLGTGKLARRGERKEASTLLISGLPAALSKSIEQTEASAVSFLVFINVQTLGQEFWGYYQSKVNRRDKINKHSQMLAKDLPRSLPEIWG